MGGRGDCTAATTAAAPAAAAAVPAAPALAAGGLQVGMVWRGGGGRLLAGSGLTRARAGCAASDALPQISERERDAQGDVRGAQEGRERDARGMRGVRERGASIRVTYASCMGSRDAEEGDGLGLSSGEAEAVQLLER